MLLLYLIVAFMVVFPFVYRMEKRTRQRRRDRWREILDDHDDDDSFEAVGSILDETQTPVRHRRDDENPYRPPVN